MKNTLHTIGHSNLSIVEFLANLRHHAISAIADVRSAPYSQRFPHFNRENLIRKLDEAGIAYVYLGDELGGRASKHSQIREGRADYAAIAESDEFRTGLGRMFEGMSRFTLALMCAEEDPAACHRSILICRSVHRDLPEIRHVRRGGRIESHMELESRLIELTNAGEVDMFQTREMVVERAYKLQAGRIAYKQPGQKALSAAESEA